MSRMILVRSLAAIPTLLVILALSFALIRLAPGGPFDLERPLDPVAVETLRRVYNLDAPLWRQFLDYLSALAHGDLGPSLAWRDYSVAELFARALPVSVALGVSALAIALPLGASAGVLAAARAGSALDYAVLIVASLGITTPSFVLGPVLQFVFGLWLKWLPVGGSGGFGHYVLPVAVLAAPQIAAVTRLTRSATMEALSAPSQRTALAYGLSERVRLPRAVPFATPPPVSPLRPPARSVMTGSVVGETLF